ncbi:glycerophosphodiester phosphodiesterase family protein [Actinomycetospora lutea]|uniref:glycerophosphodiester phosphodiesterase family protein n=1 Tax=Actinomycetospora lutea TaxID=663604 RepID=UPI0023654969|nr:glycerophosphodiester phosphodiesterase family protein [Actinomycetospora lutea]MDD7940915.1 glycerophosphodiester phosphodiesterase family protein [Actinomycetospora lutea]
MPIAHRGLHGEGQPENSVGAFVAASKAGYAIELDVHKTRDDKLVVIHDDDTERLTGTKLRVTEADARSLTDLHLDGTEYRIPLLGEALEASGNSPVLVEVKSGSDAARIGPLLLEGLSRAVGPVAVQSFDPRIVLWLRRNGCNVPIGQLSGSFKGENLPLVQRVLLRMMILNTVSRPDFIAFDIRNSRDAFLWLWRTLLRVPVLLWTVRSEQEVKLARARGANIIFEGIEPSPERET